MDSFQLLTPAEMLDKLKYQRSLIGLLGGALILWIGIAAYLLLHRCQ